MKGERFTLAAFLAAVLGAAVAAFAPVGQGLESYGSSDGTVGTRSYNISFFHTDGAWVLVVVSVPILVALVPVLVRRRPARVVSTVLLWAGCLVGAFSVGMFFVPAAILMTIAASRSDPVPVGRSVRPMPG